LRAFLAADVRFLIVGAYALALHGRPRATGDLDVWIDATSENADRVMRALADFGAPMEEIRVDDFAHPGVVYQIGLPPARINTSRDSLRERDALDQFHHDRAARACGVRFDDAVDLGDVGMIEGREYVCLAFEASQAIRMSREQIRQDLEGNVAMQLRIARPVNFAHAACPERADDLIRTEHRSGTK
jgi:hypothetical protein